VREFRALFSTLVLSSVGDELARVALTVLVYQRTSSPLLSALTFGIGYLPWLLGGPVLSALADRLPRHRVLIASDVLRALLVAAMAIPGMPLPALLALLLVVSLAAPPFDSARSALQADILDDDRYAIASSVTNVCVQLTQVVGFLLAGGLVAASSPNAALLFDAATFLISALFLRLGLRRRPAPAGGEATARVSLWQDALDGLRFIGRTPRLRSIIAVLWVATLFALAPEGLAVPFAKQLGQGSTGVGILLAAVPAGVIVGALVVGRWVPPGRRDGLVTPLVLLSLVPLVAAGLIATTAGPGPVAFGLVVALMFVGGLGSAWTIPLNVSFVQAVPASYRGRAFGVAVTGLAGVQGIGVLAAGALAEALSAGGVVAVAGGVGLIAVVVPLVAYDRTRASVAARQPVAGRSRA
jgi:MFS family permease